MAEQLQKAATQEISTGGVVADGVQVIIDNLSDEQKAELFQGARNLLCGRVMMEAVSSAADSKLFQLSEEKVDWSEYVTPQVSKGVEMYESYSAGQHALSVGGYIGADVQADVVGFGKGGGGFTVSKKKESIETETELFWTASDVLSKGQLKIGAGLVKYTAKFEQELDQLLGAGEKDAEKWAAFTARYGQYYISKCVIGGVAYSTKHQTVKDTQTRDAMKADFHASCKKGFDAVPGASVTVSGKTGAEVEETQKDQQSESSLTLHCHGGDAQLCQVASFGQWEASVHRDHKLWDVIQVLEVQPFYHLLDEAKQKKIRQLMPSHQQVQSSQSLQADVIYAIHGLAKQGDDFMDTQYFGHGKDGKCRQIYDKSESKFSLVAVNDYSADQWYLQGKSSEYAKLTDKWVVCKSDTSMFGKDVEYSVAMSKSSEKSPKAAQSRSVVKFEKVPRSEFTIAIGYRLKFFTDAKLMVYLSNGTQKKGVEIVAEPENANIYVLELEE